MALNKNIFFATNPAHTADALWQIIDASNIPLADILIFLPSRRAVRTVEEMLVQKMGHAIILPHMVALGEGVDEAEEYEPAQPNTVSNIVLIVYLLNCLIVVIDFLTRDFGTSRLRGFSLSRSPAVS